ncbi:MAG: ABC transporter substrate-binding protein, partial [Porticoccaceae bacterium]|nr:ABC transporter substrate-binding protein [Porticoccaceae bacterium]
MKIQKITTLVLTTLAIALAGCGGGDSSGGEAASAKPQKVYQWKMVTTWPKNFPGLGAAPEKFAEMVEQMS